MGYIYMHSPRICLRQGQIYGGGKEGNVLFNDTLNTFYLRLYGVGMGGGVTRVFIYRHFPRIFLRQVQIQVWVSQGCIYRHSTRICLRQGQI